MRPPAPEQFDRILSDAGALLEVWRTNGWPFAGFAVTLPVLDGLRDEDLVAFGSDISGPMDGATLGALTFRDCTLLDISITNCSIRTLRLDDCQVEGLALGDCDLLHFACERSTSEVMQLERVQAASWTIVDSQLFGTAVYHSTLRALEIRESVLRDTIVRHSTVSQFDARNAVFDGVTLTDSVLGEVRVRGGSMARVHAKGVRVTTGVIDAAAVSDLELQTCDVENLRALALTTLTNVVLGHCAVRGLDVALAVAGIAVAIVDSRLAGVRLQASALYGPLIARSEVRDAVVDRLEIVTDLRATESHFIQTRVSNVIVEGTADLRGNRFTDATFSGIQFRPSEN